MKGIIGGSNFLISDEAFESLKKMREDIRGVLDNKIVESIYRLSKITQPTQEEMDQILGTLVQVLPGESESEK